MSGYRSLHRQHVSDEEIPIWQVQSSTLLASGSTLERPQQTSTLLWAASADGIVRGYHLQEKAISEDNTLDASALTLTLTHALVGTKQVYPPIPVSLSPRNAALGCSQVSVTRNYVGEDDTTGDYIIASLDMVGRVRIWTSTQEALNKVLPHVGHGDDSTTQSTTRKMVASQEVQVESATGTILSLCPPSILGHGDVIAAVACLDGSVAMVALGISTPTTSTTMGKPKEPSPAGTILDRRGGGAIVLSLAWHPLKNCIVVGRKDGVVDIIPSTKQGTHRLLHHSRPVRAVAFTPDAQLLITGCDHGMLCVWDVNRKVPTLVHHVVQAHATWILGAATFDDSRRFVTCGADRKLHVWDVGHCDAPVHTFHCDQTIWTIHTTASTQQQQQQQRLVCGSDKGWIQIFSID